MAAKPLSRRGQITIGLLVSAVGLGVATLAAIHFVAPPEKTVLNPVVGSLAGFAFVFGGALLVVPERYGRMRAWYGALMITCVALLFDWLAFGPGERRPESGVSAGHAKVGSHLRQMSGQVLLASGAVLFNLMALWAWIRTRRAAWKGRAKT